MDNLPDLCDIRTDGRHIERVVCKLQISDSFSMLVLLTYIIVELAFVELDDIENFLCLLKLFDDLKVLQTVLRLDSSLTGCNELLQNRLALFTLTH